MAAECQDEKVPLLRDQNSSHVQDYGHSGDARQPIDIPSHPPSHVTVPPIGPDELPPPYTPSPHGMPTISCRVCGFMIDISGKRDQHVVKCTNCNEATPIKNAPPGKKYVRCPCNCLLICKAISQRIACPRPNCQRIINLAPSPATPTVPNVPGMCQVSCAHCHNPFLFNTLNNALARCPHCRKVSSVGREFAIRRGMLHLVISILFLAVALGLTIGTCEYARDHVGVYVGDVCVFIVFLLLFIRAIYYFTMKVSVIEGPV